MPKPRKWTVTQLKNAAKQSRSYRQVLQRLGLKEAGGNYEQVKKYVRESGVDVGHFTGKLWNKGLTGLKKASLPLQDILVQGSFFQSHKLKNRLYKAGLKKPHCELCGWHRVSADGRLPLELDHINGDRHDNRLQNLQILCPNCHSLQPTHRGRNIRKH